MGRSYVTKGVSIAVYRHAFEPKAGDVFYIHGKKVKVKKRQGDYVDITPSVDGIYAMSVANLYAVARVPEDSRFAGYRAVRSNPAPVARGKWIDAKIKITKAGKVLAKVGRSAIKKRKR